MSFGSEIAVEAARQDFGCFAAIIAILLLIITALIIS